MSGSVELDPGGQHLVIRFPFRQDLVDLVKTLPNRRFDGGSKCWRVPIEHAERTYQELSRHLFTFAPEVMAAVAGTLGTPAANPAGGGAASRPSGLQRRLPLPEAPGATTTATTDALTISQLNNAVRDALKQRFPTALWVVGEVLDYDKGAGREHRYFRLIERDGDAARTTATVDAVLWGRDAARLLPALAAANPSFTLRDGLQIRAKVKVDLYPATGRYQAIVEDLDPSFTLGQLALSREKILAELRQRGLEHRNRSLGFPVPALRIGVLSSPEADGWNDFVRHLQESSVGFAVTLVPVKVQGEELKPTMLAGLAWFAAHRDEFDVLCIVRGGGSRTDLAWFDDLEVALAVATHPLKILVGIGHQRDQSVLDVIAHAEKTPTAVAEFLVRLADAARDDLRAQAQRLADTALAALRQRRAGLQAVAQDLRHGVLRCLRDAAARLAQQARDVQSGARLRVAGAAGDLRAAARAIAQAAGRRLERADARLQQQATRQRLLDPARVLQRGFALVRGDGGKVLPSAGRLQPGTQVTLQFRDGSASARVDAVTVTPPAAPPTPIPPANEPR